MKEETELTRKHESFEEESQEGDGKVFVLPKNSQRL